jgi:hypothetical protein
MEWAVQHDANISSLENELIATKQVLEGTHQAMQNAQISERWQEVSQLAQRMELLSKKKRSLEESITKYYLNLKKNGETKEKNLLDVDGGDLYCCICMDNKANAAPIPCGHVCGCLECLTQIYRSNNNPRCPICRVGMKSVQKIVMSVSAADFRTPSTLLAEPFSTYGITRDDARKALNKENNDIKKAGRLLFQLAIERSSMKTASKGSGGGRGGGGGGGGGRGGRRSIHVRCFVARGFLHGHDRPQIQFQEGHV